MAYWIGVASKDHVQTGRDGGFCQLGHGKAAPIRRLSPGDWIAYYSPRTTIKGEPVQAFTAIGRIKPGEPYEVDLGNGFVPMRRDVAFQPSHDASIRALIDRLSFIKNKTNWAYPYRFGVLKVTKTDFLTVAEAMGVDPDRIT